ncbi:hypothetical protein U27_03355 [Candidatus Vecturithrix granuli]|uniref:Uncharacterized protein n=1 Tax=Vecturithrix granuli TaxID=1499967 RepID=A0A081BVN8_VECG1|nr:hypothetical protein U27_03355 [Candidatus Vecturithrix granuli]
MNKTLQALVKLQDVDTSIQEIQRKIYVFPETMKQLDKLLAENEQKVEALKTSIEEQEKLRRVKEREVEMQNEHIRRYQGQLLQVKTNKEYSALLLEIKTLKSKNSLIEDDILELMESIERAKHSLGISQKDLERNRVRIQQEKEIQEKSLTEIQNTLEKEQQRRKILAEDVDAGALREYTKLLNLRNGVAISAVEEDGVCTGCHVALTPQMFAEIKTGNYLHRCPICFRFLYWANSENQQEDM